MKAMNIVCAMVALILSAYLPAYSETASATIKIDPLPKTGTYFIISASSHDALQPNAPSLGQNVFLSEYNKGGTQKWIITRKIDAKTKKPTNRYTIRLAGENKELNFQPHPSIGDASPILGTDSAVFALEPSQDGLLVKSVEKNGDAMYVYQSSDQAAPAFGHDDGSNKFRWNFLNAASTSAISNNAVPLPDTGTYFITNASSNEALQPNAPSLGQTVFLSEYNKGGTQKWTINRKIDPVTNKPTNRYTIRLAGEAADLNFQPHPSTNDAAPILGTDKSIFVLEPSQEGLLIKSVAKNGDAMYVFTRSSENAEPLFGPDDGSKKFRWNFLSPQ